MIGVTTDAWVSASATSDSGQISELIQSGTAGGRHLCSSGAAQGHDHAGPVAAEDGSKAVSCFGGDDTPRIGLLVAFVDCGVMMGAPPR